jgi:hypothetical protein
MQKKNKNDIAEMGREKEHSGDSIHIGVNWCQLACVPYPCGKLLSLDVHICKPNVEN